MAKKMTLAGRSRYDSSITSGLLLGEGGKEGEEERERERELHTARCYHAATCYSLCRCHQYVETDKAHLKAVKKLYVVHEKSFANINF